MSATVSSEPARLLLDGRSPHGGSKGLLVAIDIGCTELRDSSGRSRGDVGGPDGVSLRLAGLGVGHRKPGDGRTYRVWLCRWWGRAGRSLLGLLWAWLVPVSRVALLWRGRQLAWRCEGAMVSVAVVVAGGWCGAWEAGWVAGWQ